MLNLNSLCEQRGRSSLLREVLDDVFLVNLNRIDNHIFLEVGDGDVACTVALDLDTCIIVTMSCTHMYAK